MASMRETGVCHSRGLDWVGAAGNECQYSIAGNHSQCSSSPFTILSGAVASDAQTDGSGGWTRAGVGQNREIDPMGVVTPKEAT